jgi:hypothetical protein
MTIARILLSVVSFSVALIAGFKAGENVNYFQKTLVYSMDANTMPGVPIPNNDQYNLLLIGVDDVKRSDAKLQSIWLLAFPKNSSKVMLVPLFPAADKPVRNLLLAESFHMHNGKPSQEFWDEMRKTDTWWKGYSVNDKSRLISLVDSLDGISINGKQFNGTQAVGSIPNWKSDPQYALEQQKSVFEGICKRIAGQRVIQSTGPGKFTQHMNLSNNTTLLITQWMTQIKANNRLNCYFPTYERIPPEPTPVTP